MFQLGNSPLIFTCQVLAFLRGSRHVTFMIIALSNDSALQTKQGVQASLRQTWCRMQQAVPPCHTSIIRAVICSGHCRRNGKDPLEGGRQGTLKSTLDVFSNTRRVGRDVRQLVSSIPPPHHNISSHDLSSLRLCPRPRHVHSLHLHLEAPSSTFPTTASRTALLLGHNIQSELSSTRHSP